MMRTYLNISSMYAPLILGVGYASLAEFAGPRYYRLGIDSGIPAVVSLLSVAMLIVEAIVRLMEVRQDPFRIVISFWSTTLSIYAIALMMSEPFMHGDVASTALLVPFILGVRQAALSRAWLCACGAAGFCAASIALLLANSRGSAIGYFTIGSF